MSRAKARPGVDEACRPLADEDRWAPCHEPRERLAHPPLGLGFRALLRIEPDLHLTLANCAAGPLLFVPLLCLRGISLLSGNPATI
jgi:hypothetical protein